MLQIQVDIKSQVQVAESDPAQARKLFGIDQMSTDQRKVALRKTTLVRYLCSVSSLTSAQGDIGFIGYYERGAALPHSTEDPYPQDGNRIRRT